MGIETLGGADLAVLLVAALLAGALDASVGSGGAVLLPALIGASPPGVAASVPLAVNKAVAVAGNLVAARRYRSPGAGPLDRGLLAATLGCALAGVLLGAWLATRIDVALLTWMAAAALAALVAGLLLRAHRRRRAAEARRAPPHPRAVPAVIGGIAIYDGMIGPATGSLLQLALQRLLARPVHECLAAARLVQALLNLAAGIALWMVTAPDPRLVALLAALHALGGWAGAAIARRIPESVLHRLLIACIALSVLRMVLVR